MSTKVAAADVSVLNKIKKKKNHILLKLSVIYMKDIGIAFIIPRKKIAHLPGR